MTTLQEKLEELMVARDHATEASWAHKEALEHWLATVGHHLEEIVGTAKGQVGLLEAEVREMALAVFNETQDKNPAPGVAIRMNRLAGYSPDAALEWARDHKMALIPEKLDERDYAKLVLEGRAPGTVLEEPQAAIARDLAKALKGD